MDRSTRARRDPDSATQRDIYNALYGRARGAGGALARHAAACLGGRGQAGLLSLGRIPARPLRSTGWRAWTATWWRKLARRWPRDHDLDRIAAEETDPGLGNGGLGRLAACYLDSLATLQFPAVGYGIRYDYGIFTQTIDEDGRQREIASSWLRHYNPWEIPRDDASYVIRFNGRCVTTHARIAAPAGRRPTTSGRLPTTS